MPIVTFIGPMAFRRRADMSGQWLRNEPVEVSQKWLDQERRRLSPNYFRIEGDAGITVDEGDDGIPDEGWTKKDISAWLKGKGLTWQEMFLTRRPQKKMNWAKSPHNKMEMNKYGSNI